MSKVKDLSLKVKNTLKDEGVGPLVKKTVNYTKFKVTALNRKYDRGFKDILFINGCCLPHPQRYRVDHQIEQFESYGLSCDKIDYDKLTLDMLRFYRGFVFYRCPILPVIEEFIKQAKENNKTCFYDIDDLVFDTKYTDQIKYVQSLTGADRDLYDDGVKRMGKTLDLCEYAIASTDRLQKEMALHVKEVFVNRNVASEEMVKYSEIALNTVEKDDSKIIIGYLSGTITHNDDFKLIMPSIIKILKKYPNVYLQIVGLLDLPEEMEDVKDKVLTSPFMDWKDLPKLIRSIDINLAPLEDTIFNEAKSENKWTEAALVKIPTVASNVGAFKSAIVANETGLLCDNLKDWEENLSKLIENKEYRETIALNAYNEVMKHHVTTTSGRAVVEFVKSKLRRNICFILPSTNISGGVMIAVKHGIFLKKHGYDVTAININEETKNVSIVTEGIDSLLVVSYKRTEFLAYIDTMVATMWLTLKYAREYANCKNIKYLVQSMETGFYKPGQYEKRMANSTYNSIFNVDYLTISKWCKSWLKEDFLVDAKYAPNGIDLTKFKEAKRKKHNKIRILIEGNSKDFYKNVDESFKIVEKLDKSKYEISYLSYEKEPKKWYHVDNFYHKIPHDEVAKIYQNHDVLIKTSILESFSYPPLEMMATGGLVLALPNGGNSEYLKDEYNCLLYKQGDIEEAVEKLERLVADKKLQEKLITNGIKTAKEYSWENIEDKILDLYN